MHYLKFFEHINCVISEESKQNEYNMIPKRFLLGIFECFLMILDCLRTKYLIYIVCC